MKKNSDEQIMTAKAFATLSDKTSLDIANRLKNDDLSFTELQKSTNLDKNSLYYKIKNLIKSGIIVNYYQKRKNTSEYSFYQITSFGKKIMRGHTDTMFVDAKDRTSAIKKARKKLQKRFSKNLTKTITSVQQQGQKKGRYVVWYTIRARKK